MLSRPNLYPPRDRTTNIALIESLRTAQSQEEFDRADEKIGMDIHPSLLAELDWMEMTMPAEHQVDGANLVDGLFFHHLPAIIAQRQSDFDLSEEDLQWEVMENLDFYKHLLREANSSLDVLGSTLKQRIQRHAQNVDRDIERIVFRLCEFNRTRIGDEFSGIKDPNWLLLMIDVEIQNTLVKALDHVASRVQTKQFIRHIGGHFPQVQITSLESQTELQSLLTWLADLETTAQKFLVHQLAAVCRLLHEVFFKTEIAQFKDFNG